MATLRRLTMITTFLPKTYWSGRSPFSCLTALLLTTGLIGPGVNRDAAADTTPASYVQGTPVLGAHYDANGSNIIFGVFSSRAGRIEVFLYAHPQGEDEKARFPLVQDATTNLWTTTVSAADLARNGIGDVVYYGYRAWGPNWVYDA